MNCRIKLLAPVLNTQSIKYQFSPDVDTMFRSHDGFAEGGIQAANNFDHATCICPVPPTQGQEIAVVPALARFEDSQGNVRPESRESQWRPGGRSSRAQVGRQRGTEQ
ncbi:hypothetical protein ACFXPA_16645 [Amycolatopsis sp. NPDC059090]|uniref:hypothetical protein n=1 Tax=Amycolatopsis sp. NPDC059090 TaxID=3346723 RepID=UPI00366BB1A1